MAQGLSFIGIIDVYARWAPPNERVRLSNLAYLGYGVGVAINYPLSGFIIQNFGWRYLFYMYGKLYEYLNKLIQIVMVET